MPTNSVYLFGTCLIDIFYPKAGMDTISLLELSGFDVIFPQSQTCCGQPPYNSGYSEQAREIAKKTIHIFSEQKIPLIVPSASCAGMIKLHYPTLFEKGSDEYLLAIELAQRTYELIDFLVDKLPYDKQVESSFYKVGLHESCCSQFEMNVSSAWQQVLSRLENVEVCLPTLREECCGFGGTFAVKSEDISAAMTDDKCRHLLAPEPDHIVSGDSGCLMNIAEHLRYQNIENKKTEETCLHLASFIAQRFGIAHER